MKYRKHFIIIFLCFVSISCGPEGEKYPPTTPNATIVRPEYTDRSFLTGDPCTPPCWYGLKLDVSTEDEVMSVLETLPFVDPTSIEIFHPGFHDALTEEYFTATRIYVSNIGNGSIDVTIAGSVLKLIHSGLNYEITIGEIVNQIGPPDVVYTIPGGESDYCSVDIIWLDKQLSASYNIYSSDSLKICPFWERVLMKLRWE